MYISIYIYVYIYHGDVNLLYVPFTLLSLRRVNNYFQEQVRNIVVFFRSFAMWLNSLCHSQKTHAQ